MKRILILTLFLLLVMASTASAITQSWTDPTQASGVIISTATIVCSGTAGAETVITAPACIANAAVTTPCVACTAATQATTCTQSSIAQGTTEYCKGYLTDSLGQNSALSNEVSLAEPFFTVLPMDMNAPTGQ